MFTFRVCWLRTGCRVFDDNLSFLSMPIVGQEFNVNGKMVKIGDIDYDDPIPTIYVERVLSRN
jgi:hypothetical protein